MNPESNFVTEFENYRTEIKIKQNADRAEAEILTYFTHFIKTVFQVDAKVFIQEQTIRMATIEGHQRGRIDLLFGDLVLEFKKSIAKKADARQLENYLRAKAAEGLEYTGIFTDGLRFQIYGLDGDSFQQIDYFNLDDLPPESARLKLDAYFFSQHNIIPTAEDIVIRYGAHSPTFRKAAQILRRLLAQVKPSPMLATWRGQWERLLSKVYGAPVGNDEWFIRHTYLSQFARLLAYHATKPPTEPTDDLTREAYIESIINGQRFAASGFTNIAEADFFSWILMDSIRQEALDLFVRLDDTLIVYNLRRIHQDLLKQLYQDLIDERHDLGEYYTPDWLAELTLQEIDYSPGQSLLDPTCGSGTFLFSAIKHLEKRGLTGQPLVDFAVNHIVGVDVHPLAVTIARINYLLALAPHLPNGTNSPTAIPVYMADALLTSAVEDKTGVQIVPVSDNDADGAFRIPNETASYTDLLPSILDLMENLLRAGDDIGEQRFIQSIQRVYENNHLTYPDGISQHWINNFALLRRLIAEDRNRIWAFILKNIAGPQLLAQRKFDVVAGNPPWLSYRYIKRPDYQQQIKSAYIHYGLLTSKDAKLFTQMDLSTLFYAAAQERYLKPTGTLAFVLPRSVITGAKQHRPFQQTRRITRILDFQEVEPLFKVPTCVLIDRRADPNPTPTIPASAYTGKLPQQELPLADAQPHLTSAPKPISFVSNDIRSPHYHANFFQGATLVPRTLCFVVPEGFMGLRTDPEARLDAKEPYKNLHVSGFVHAEYRYATLLSKHLIPFGFEKLHLVALPFDLGADGRLTPMAPIDFIYNIHFESGHWFERAAAGWDRLKKSGDKKSFVEQLNYRNKIVNQKPQHPYKVLYNASGSNIAACVLDIAALNLKVHNFTTRGFIVDAKTYYYDAASVEESHYLCALLNAERINQAIKGYQSEGLMGPRDIHRTPFEACGIPPFDPTNPDHLELVALSQAAHEAIDLLKASGLKGKVAAIRRAARQTTQAQLAAIDKLAARVVSF